MKLNLEAKTKEQELVKAYLEENASETLAEKINNGVRIEKDGKTLLNRKSLDGFFRYASDEARKLASKGANFACVEARSFTAGQSTTLRRTASKARSLTRTAPNTRRSPNRHQRRRW